MERDGIVQLGEQAEAAVRSSLSYAEARAVEVKTQAAEAMERLQADRLKTGLPAEVAVVGDGARQA